MFVYCTTKYFLLPSLPPLLLLSSSPADGFVSLEDFVELMSEVMVQTTRWGNLSTKLEGDVGFDTVQEQIRKKSLKRGFEFNLMVVGEPLGTVCVCVCVCVCACVPCVRVWSQRCGH